MAHRLARGAFVSLLLAAATRAPTQTIDIVPCGDLPASLAALGAADDRESFGVATAADTAVATFPSPSDVGRSILRFARGGEEPRSIPLAGRAVGLAVSDDGELAYAIVRTTDRKGAVRTVELVRVELTSGRVSAGSSLPNTACGIAFGPGGSTLLVAARDELRTFRLPDLASGPLYRVPGDNVGVVSVGGSSHVLVAQRTRVVRADLAAPQGRDGLAFDAETASPAPFRGMMASVSGSGPVALAADGPPWCLRGGAPPVPPLPPIAPEGAAPDSAPSTEPAPAVVPPPKPLEETADVPPPPPQPAPAIPEPLPTPGRPGTVFGMIDGPSKGDVAAIVLFGPDNVLREAARRAPDEQGRFSVDGLAPGSYRIVAAGKGGRVLICDPPFVTVRVGSDGAVEAQVLRVLRAP